MHLSRDFSFTYGLVSFWQNSFAEQEVTRYWKWLFCEANVSFRGMPSRGLLSPSMDDGKIFTEWFIFILKESKKIGTNRCRLVLRIDEGLTALAAVPEISLLFFPQSGKWYLFFNLYRTWSNEQSFQVNIAPYASQFPSRNRSNFKALGVFTI